MNNIEISVITQEEKIAKALSIAVQWGGFDGGHHKAWVIDQMVRALTGCPIVEATATDYKGVNYSFKAQGESLEYKALLVDAKSGEDGPNTYSWDEGIPP